jgi:hypothetical protein
MKVINDKKEPTIAPDHPDEPLAYALLMEARKRGRPKNTCRSCNTICGWLQLEVLSSR